MRAVADAPRIRALMRALGREAEVETRIYLAGGATAVLLGWRTSTIDADLEIAPESDCVFRSLPRLKEALDLNIELASPAHFIPELPGWRERSPFVAREGLVSFHHYDFYAQALAKIERGHLKDQGDVAAMLDRGLIEPDRLRELFDQIQDRLYRYPAIDPPAFRRSLERALAGR